jgi:hypothetical protein
MQNKPTFQKQNKDGPEQLSFKPNPNTPRLSIITCKARKFFKKAKHVK